MGTVASKEECIAKIKNMWTNADGAMYMPSYRKCTAIGRMDGQDTYNKYESCQFKGVIRFQMFNFSYLPNTLW